MADKPARALILYGDGLIRGVQPRHSHIHSVASAGCCGFLALRTLPNNPASSGDDDSRVVAELAQVLDLHDIYQRTIAAQGALTSDKNKAGDEQIPSMSDRFMGLKAGMITNSEPSALLGEQAGFSILELQDGKPVFDDNTPIEPSVTAFRLLTLLGLQEGPVNTEQSNFELLLLHLSAKDQLCTQQVDWVDALLGDLQKLSHPGTKAGSHLYLILVLGYGSVESCRGDTRKEDGFPSVVSDGNIAPKLLHLYPPQSYKRKGGNPVEDVREHHPLLVAYYLDAVTRRDDVKSFSYHEFQTLSGNLTILVDRFLHEIAFKLWKAPKYGA